ncbi:serine/arginine-rich SC35-like splicing factor SCL28 isoform X1 [Zingiber officinale]|uniref:serine/arginine-rich SC35-like splicing factor SCL28 isoform X1 n=1 Tax=Zingiber officinale TaxID=94328 RepID=UPI001C4D20AA|nr:serine/arginine-rich SC35-like splicing factor SCL28 isoform X1 [Zingiber officinale]
MGRYRSRSRSYSPRRYSRSPPRRKHYDDPRDRYHGGGGGGGRGGGRDYRSAPSGLLIRNISLDARPEDLRIPFERFGPVKDVYLPKNYYTGEPRGFGFVKFRYAEDAAVAKQHMNRQIIGGREISIVYAEENRKTPQEMRKMTRISERHMGGRHRRSLSRSPRQRHRSYSHSPTPRHDSRDNGRGGRDYYSPPRSVSPSPLNGRDYGSPDDRDHRSKRSERQSPGPEVNEQSPSRSRSYSPK